MSLVYFNCDTNLTTEERSYAIRWLKERHTILVYRDSVIRENLVEYWFRYLPRGNNIYNFQSDYCVFDRNMICGYFWDKHRNRHINACMPSTKEVKYLKNFEIKSGII